MPQRYHPYDPSDPKPATMYPADEGAYVKWEDYVVLLRRSHDLNMEVWKAVVDTDVFPMNSVSPVMTRKLRFLPTEVIAWGRKSNIRSSSAE